MMHLPALRRAVSRIRAQPKNRLPATSTLPILFTMASYAL